MAENYGHIEKYKRLHKKAKKIIDTTELHHTGAYTKAAEEVLKDEDGLIDYNRLKLREYQSKFAEEMSDFYIGKAEKTFRIRIKERDDFEKALLMNAYAGVTKAGLKELLRKNKNHFTLTSFEKELKPEFMKSIKFTLYGATKQHLGKEHIDDIIKYVGIEHLVDTKYMQLKDALDILEIHTETGVMPEKQLEDKLYYTKRKEAEEKTREEIKKSELEKKAK